MPGSAGVPPARVENKPPAGQRPALPGSRKHFFSNLLERLNRITVEQGKCGGRPCIRGYRIRVSDVLQLLANGASIEEILNDYSFLEREDILAALEYAAHLTDHPILQAS